MFSRNRTVMAESNAYYLPQIAYFGRKVFSVIITDQAGSGRAVIKEYAMDTEVTTTTEVINESEDCTAVGLVINSSGFLYVVGECATSPYVRIHKSTSAGDSTAWGSAIGVSTTSGNVLYGYGIDSNNSIWTYYGSSTVSNVRELNSSDALQSVINISSLSGHTHLNGHLIIAPNNDIYISHVIQVTSGTARHVVALYSPDSGVNWRIPSSGNWTTAATLPITALSGYGDAIASGPSSSTKSNTHIAIRNTDNRPFFLYHDGSTGAEDSQYYLADYVAGGWTNFVVTIGVTADGAAAVATAVFDKDDNLYLLFSETNTGPVKMLYGDFSDVSLDIDEHQFLRLQMIHVGVTFAPNIAYLRDDTDLIDLISWVDYTSTTSQNINIFNAISYKNHSKIVRGDVANYFSFPNQVTCANDDIVVWYTDGAGHATADKRMLQSRSPDGGTSWVNGGLIHDPTDPTFGAQAGMITREGANLFGLIREHKTPPLGGDNTRSLVAKSTTNGTSWGSFVDISQEFVNGVLENPHTIIGSNIALMPVYSEYRTVLHLQMNGTDGSTTFVDNSNSRHIITANGNAQIDTAQSVFDGASALFDGTGDYLSIPDSPDFDFSGDDWYFNARIRLPSLPAGEGGIFGQATDSDNYIRFYVSSGGGTVFRVVSGGSLIISVFTGVTINVDTFHNVSILQQGNNFHLFVDNIDETSGGSPDTNNAANYTGDFLIGAHDLGSGPTNFFDGWIDEVNVATRITGFQRFLLKIFKSTDTANRQQWRQVAEFTTQPSFSLSESSIFYNSTNGVIGVVMRCQLDDAVSRNLPFRICFSSDSTHGTRQGWTDPVRMGDTDDGLILHMEGTDGSTTFTDSAGRHIITANGNAQIDTAFSAIGDSSALFDGTGDYLSIPDSPDFDFSGVNFKESWVMKINTLSADMGIFGQATDSNNYMRCYVSSGGGLVFRVVLSGSIVVSAFTGVVFAAGGTYSVTLAAKIGGEYKIYVNGRDESGGSAHGGAPAVYTGDFLIGAYDVGSGPQNSFDGWIDEFISEKDILSGIVGHEIKPFCIYTSDNAALLMLYGRRDQGTGEAGEIAALTYVYSLDDGITWFNGDVIFNFRSALVTVEYGYMSASLVPGTNHISVTSWVSDDTTNIKGQIISSFLTWDPDFNRVFSFKRDTSSGLPAEIISSNGLIPTDETPPWTVGDNSSAVVAEVNDAMIYVNDESLLILHMEGTDGSTTFIDSTGRHTITANGGAEIDTDQSAVGSSSCLLNGTDAYLSIPDSDDFDFSGGVWSVESHFRVTALPAGEAGLWGQATNTNNYMKCYVSSGGGAVFRVYSGGVLVVSVFTGVVFVANTWYKVRATENGNNYALFVNDVDETTGGSPDTSRPADYTGNFLIGAKDEGSGAQDFLSGWMDEVILSIGSAGVVTPTTWFTSSWGGDLSVEDYSIFLKTSVISESDSSRGVYFEISDGTDSITMEFNQGLVRLNDGSIHFVDFDNINTSPWGMLEIRVSSGIYSVIYNNVVIKSSVALSTTSENRILFGNGETVFRGEVHWDVIRVFGVTVTGVGALLNGGLFFGKTRSKLL